MKLIDILVQELPKRGGWPEGAKTVAQDSCGEVWGFNCSTPKINNGLWWTSASGTDLISSSRDQLNLLADDWNSTFVTRDQYEAALAAKNDGWIDWGGGECPVEKGTLVDVKWRDGRIDDSIPAKISHDLDSSKRNAISWRHHGNSHDIIAYRLHKPQEVTEADEEADLNECIGQDVALVWSGDGLPPVGCEVEYITGILGKPDADDNKPENGQIVRVVAHAKYEDTGNDVVVATWLNGNGGMRASVFSHKCLQPIRSEADKKREEAVNAMLSVFGSNAATGTTAALKAIYDAIAAGKIPDVKLEG